MIVKRYMSGLQIAQLEASYARVLLNKKCDLPKLFA